MEKDYAKRLTKTKAPARKKRKLKSIVIFLVLILGLVVIASMIIFKKDKPLWGAIQKQVKAAFSKPRNHAVLTVSNLPKKAVPAELHFSFYKELPNMHVMERSSQEKSVDEGIQKED